MTSAGSMASRPSSVHSACSRVCHVSAVDASGDERRNRSRVAALDEQALRGVAPPAVRMRQRFHELGGRGVSQRRAGVARRRLVHHAVDAAESGAPIEPALENLIAQVFGDRDAVLDDAAIQIGDVERAVGRIGQIDRPEALVGGGEELSARVGLARGQALAAVLEDEARHEVRRRFGDEHVAVELRRQTVAAIDRRRAHRGELEQRSVGAIDARLIGAVGARIRPDRPDDVQVFVAGGEPLVAAAGADQVGVARVVVRSGPGRRAPPIRWCCDRSGRRRLR